MGAVALEVVDSVAVASMSRPPLNLLSRQMLTDLHSVLESLRDDSSISVLVIRSDISGIFSAGSDMKEFSEVSEDPLNRKILFEDYLLRYLERMPFPTIAEIDGHALGGGFELALACDLRIATSSSKIGLPEVKIGGLGTNGLVRLIGLVGRSRALDLVYTGRTVDASEALEMGLVNRVVDELPAAALDPSSLARLIADQSRSSLRFAKDLASQHATSSLEQFLDKGVRIQRDVFASPDLLAGSSAFLEKKEIRFPSHGAPQSEETSHDS